MLRDQNRIELKVNNSPYEEYVLDPAETGAVLPGSLVSLFSIHAGTMTKENTNQPMGGNTPNQIGFPPNAQADSLLAGRVQSQVHAEAATIAEIEPIIVIENDLVGRTINHKSRPGEVIRTRRAVSGDIFLARVVVGSYKVGQPLYPTQTANGIYLTAVKPTDVPALAYAQENYVVDATMVDLIDDANTDFPTTPQTVGGAYYRNLNGVPVNLLRVRFK